MRVCNAQSDVGQQAVTGFTPAVLPNRLRICFRICMRIWAHTLARECTRAYVYITYTRASPFSAAVPISGGTASRCIREAHRSYTRDVDFQSPPHLRFSPFFFHSIGLPPFHWLPPTLRLNFLCTARIRVTRRILINNVTTDLCALLPIVPSFLSALFNRNQLVVVPIELLDSHLLYFRVSFRAQNTSAA